MRCLPHLLAAALLSACAGEPQAERRRDDTAPIQVTLTVEDDPSRPLQLRYDGHLTDASGGTLRFAAGVVGAYRPLDFAAFVGGVRAFGSSGEAVPVTAGADGTWRVEGASTRLEYRVDTAAAAAAISDALCVTRRRPGFVALSGYGVFGILDGAHRRTYRLRFGVPESWSVVSSLRPAPDGGYVANAFELRDEPAFLGMNIISSPAGARTRSHVWREGGRVTDAECRAVAATVEAALEGVAALGLPAADRPFHAFFELVSASPGTRVGWAMEHGHAMHAYDDANRKIDVVDSRLAYHVLHHVLHAWIPRRLYTECLHPERMIAGHPTSAIWFSEGVAQYLAFCALARSGMVDTAGTLAMLARRFVRPLEGAKPTVVVSPSAHSTFLCSGDHEHWTWEFAAGGMFALKLDQRMRRSGDGRTGLAEIVAGLFARFADDPRGIPVGDLPALLSAACGDDLSLEFSSWIDGTEPWPVDEILRGTGVIRDGESFRVVDDADVDDDVRRFRRRAFGSAADRAAAPNGR